MPGKTGTILLGKDKDPVSPRPAWAVEGSFLAFRQLKQLVPEFHEFLDNNPIVLPGLDRKQGSELLGARLLGRWKSGMSYIPLGIMTIVQITAFCRRTYPAFSPPR
jgi:hypothetical protein